MIAMQYINKKQELSILNDSQGNSTSHLQGLLYRSVIYLENGIKPIYVFDGKPPDMKSGVLQKRSISKQSAIENIKVAIHEKNVSNELKYNKRSTILSQQNIDDAKKMLELLGVPIIEVYH